MRSSSLLILLIGLFCPTAPGCVFDRGPIPVGDSNALDATDEGDDKNADGREGEPRPAPIGPDAEAGAAAVAEGGLSLGPDAGQTPGTEPEGTGVDRTAPPASNTGCPGTDCDFVALCGGNYFSCGLVGSGRAVCWGDNTHGQLGREGTSREFGYVQTQADVPLEGVAQLACGTQHACAVLDDHTVRCWGAGDEGQLGKGVGPNAPYASERVEIAAADQVVAGTDLSCARLQSGQVSCWGKNAQGQLGRGVSSEVLGPAIVAQLTGVTSLSLRTRTVYAIAGEDRQLLAWGTGRGAVPVPVYNETWADKVKDVSAVGAGAAHGCFVVGAEKRVLCTGWDAFAQIGQGASPCGDGWCENAMPVQHAGGKAGLLSGVDQLIVSANSACVLIGGQVHCWGANSYGELGIGVANFIEFAPMPSLTRSAAEAALAPDGEEGLLSAVFLLGGGYRHFCAQRKAGELLCWGHGEAGQLGAALGASTRPMIVPALR